MQVDHAKIRREAMRWNIMLFLNRARPIGATEQMIFETMQALYPDTTPLEVRRELSYLDERVLVEVEVAPAGTWFAKLTRHGIDVAEYTVDCQPGVARPPKYWAG